MAKERRTHERTKAGGGAASPSRVMGRDKTTRPTSAVEPISQGSTHLEAVALYERGLGALQRHDYMAAADLLQSVLHRYPEERELQERVRLYLAICQRHAQQEKPVPRTIDERLFASTIALNGGRYDEAISHLRLVRDEDPDNDHALYMLAAAHAQRGELAEATAHLERAIALNPENRGLARHDPDLEPLRGDEAFRSAVDGFPMTRIDRRRGFRPRTGR